MSEIRTCEQYVLDKLRETEDLLENKQKLILDLQDKLKERDDICSNYEKIISIVLDRMSFVGDDKNIIQFSSISKEDNPHQYSLFKKLLEVQNGKEDL